MGQCKKAAKEIVKMEIIYQILDILTLIVSVMILFKVRKCKINSILLGFNLFQFAINVFDDCKIVWSKSINIFIKVTPYL